MSTIASLAILKVNWEQQGKDYIECFLPFVAECLHEADDDVVALPSLRDSLDQRFGLRIPLNSLRVVLQRARKRGFVRKDNNIYYRVAEKCAEVDLRRQSAEVVRQHQLVLDRLVVFAQESHETAWTSAQAEEALMVFLADHELSTVFAWEEGNAVNAPQGKGHPYVVGRFVEACSRSEPQLFDALQTIVKGNILANAMFLPAPESIAQKFEKTRVYIDTSILVYACGHAGPERHAPCAELLSLLRACGADLHCLTITLDEIRGILTACAERIERGQLKDAWGPSIEYFLESKLTSTDIYLRIERLPAKLKELGVRISERPSYEEHEYVVDEGGFDAHVQKEIGYKSNRARVHDVDCVAAIARLRRGTYPTSVERCRAIFVTANATLARAAQRFFHDEAPPGSVALCISDHALGNLMWLKNPTKAPDLPRQQLIADAYAATQPSDQLWKKYLTEIARLEEQGEISADDYVLLRFSTSARRAMMDITQGDDAAFAEASAKELLEVAKQNVRADLESQLSAKQGLLDHARGEVDTLKIQASARSERINQRAHAVGRLASRAALGLFTLLVLVALAATFTHELLRDASPWVKWPLVAAESFFILVGFVSQFRETTARTISDALGSRVSDRVESWMRRLLEPGA